MRIKRLLAVVAAFATVAVSSCGQKIESESLSTPENAEIITTTQEGVTPESADEEVVADKDAVNYDEQKITGTEIKYTKFSKSINAEDATVAGGAKVDKTRKGFKGKGYVTSIYTESELKIEFDLPSAQYYNVTICFASDDAETNSLAINSEAVSKFSSTGDGKFETRVVKNLYLEKGKNTVTIIPEAAEKGKLDIDYCTIEASDEISKMDLSLKSPALSNKNADYNAQALYQYICENYGKKVILGQYDQVGTSSATTLIYNTTGKYPAIRFGDMQFFTDKDSVVSQTEIPCAEQWAKDGGIVGYMWYWYQPIGDKEIDTDKTTFDLSKAVTKEDIATKSIDEIKKLEEDGKVSKECVALVEDIDLISEQLSTLQDNGIAVLWRPLHEASNGIYWWGQDVDSYKWLWKLMYNRQTNYHKLNNLIWVWSAQNKDWYVGDEYCDILSCDVFYNSQPNTSGEVNNLLYLQAVSKNKPIAMSECGNYPSIQSIADEKSMWSYIGQWRDNIMNDDATLCEDYISEEDLVKMLNNNLTITRDQLPDFTHLANEIKKQKESTNESASSEAAKETTTTKATKAAQ